MPAFVNSSVLSCGIRLADGTTVCPRAAKKSRNARAKLVGGPRRHHRTRLPLALPKSRSLVGTGCREHRRAGDASRRSHLARARRRRPSSTHADAHARATDGTAVDRGAIRSTSARRRWATATPTPNPVTSQHEPARHADRSVPAAGAQGGAVDTSDAHGERRRRTPPRCTTGPVTGSNGSRGGGSSTPAADRGVARRRRRGAPCVDARPPSIAGSSSVGTCVLEPSRCASSRRASRARERSVTTHGDCTEPRSAEHRPPASRCRSSVGLRPRSCGSTSSPRPLGCVVPAARDLGRPVLLVHPASRLVVRVAVALAVAERCARQGNERHGDAGGPCPAGCSRTSLDRRAERGRSTEFDFGARAR